MYTCVCCALAYDVRDLAATALAVESHVVLVQRSPHRIRQALFRWSVKRLRAISMPPCSASVLLARVSPHVHVTASSARLRERKRKREREREREGERALSDTACTHVACARSHSNVLTSHSVSFHGRRTAVCGTGGSGDWRCAPAVPAGCVHILHAARASNAFGQGRRTSVHAGTNLCLTRTRRLRT